MVAALLGGEGQFWQRPVAVEIRSLYDEPLTTPSFSAGNRTAAAAVASRSA